MPEQQQLTERFSFRGRRRDLRRLQRLSAIFELADSRVLRLSLRGLEELIKLAAEKGECPCKLRQRLERTS